MRQTIRASLYVPTGIAIGDGVRCQGVRGDCDLDGIGPDVLDAFQSATITAGLSVPTPAQVHCCDVNGHMQSDVLDALLIARSAAWLPIVFTCP